MVSDKDRPNLTFAEAEGKVQYPGVLKWGELDQRLRAALWNRFWIDFDNWIDESESSYDTHYEAPLRFILLREHVHRRMGFANEFQETFQGKKAAIAFWAKFFRSSDYIELFDFIMFFLRDRDCPSDLKKPPTIIPAATPEEATIIKRDLEAAFSSRFGGAKVHLQSALDALNKGDNRAVVRESINSVESAIRDFTGDANAVLSKAIKKLTDEFGLHPTLAMSFEKLYAYTSDEKGIRHALVFGENEKVGFDEAMFFVSACSAFIALLSRKANAAKSQA
jgi:hypothetical protein